MANVYEANNVMKLLGHQYYNAIVSEENLKGIEDIIKANLESDRPDLKMLKYDIFVYGYLMGVRAERRRKKEGKKKHWLF